MNCLMALNNTNKNDSILLEVLASVFKVSAYFPDNPRIYSEKREEICESPMTKVPTPTVKSKKQRDNMKTSPQTSITHQQQQSPIKRN